MDEKGRLGVGIHGTGSVAIQHAAGFESNPNTYVAAVCGRSMDSASRFAAKNAPNAKVYDNLEDMLNDSAIDIMTECMPNYLHADSALMALQANKHLLLEKPAGITFEETDALYEAAKKSKCKTVVSFVCRWEPLMINLKKLLDEKAIGDVFFCGSDYWHGIKTTFASYNWIRQKRFAGGAMITGGCHAADQARYMNGEIEEVMAFSTHYRPDFDYMTTLSASVKYRNGSVGRLSACLDGVNYPYQFNLDILGSEGAIRGNRFWSKKLFPMQEKWIELPMQGPETGTVSCHPFKNEIDDFVESILHDTPVRSDLMDAVKSMDVVIAITESAMTGKPVFIKERT
ncbi:MAG TPA: hypothetical protein DCP98_02315 [Sphaerochaeta sp.]|nr:hypothetical protein [Sphaerochaeta sp.]